MKLFGISLKFSVYSRASELNTGSATSERLAKALGKSLPKITNSSFFPPDAWDALSLEGNPFIQCFQ